MKENIQSKNIQNDKENYKSDKKIFNSKLAKSIPSKKRLGKRRKPWQLVLFKFAVKKKDKFKTLARYLGKIYPNKKYLDIGCGTGAISYYLRKIGGNWHTVDNDKNCVEISKTILKENVYQRDGLETGFKDNTFHKVVSLDIIEHIKDDDAFIEEVKRILEPNGEFVITTPSLDGFLFLNKIKDLIGLTPDKYGHVRAGYKAKDLRRKLMKHGFSIVLEKTYSRFFTELIELCINFAYICLRKNKTKGYNADVSPSSQKDLKAIKKMIMPYKIMHPLFSLISSFDNLILFTKGYGLLIRARKE